MLVANVSVDVGASKTADLFSWKAVAEYRIQDHGAALGIAH
jgi:hypothetical protein